jgi:hypothetical protein
LLPTQWKLGLELWFLGHKSEQREFPGPSGGGGGIRTHETLSGLTVFKTAGVNRFPTPPFFFTTCYILTYAAFADNPCPAANAVMFADVGALAVGPRASTPARFLHSPAPREW